MNLLVTGGAGFIGSNFVKMVLKEHTNVKVTVLDALTYSGGLDNFPEEVWEKDEFQFCYGSILDRDLVFNLMQTQDKVVHFAAYTHVDRSIDVADPFIDTDFKGTQILLEAIRKYPVKRFIHISTSEVYGTAKKIPMPEEHPLLPQSPYAGVKAGADRLVYSYWRTYNLPIVIIRPFNVYGENQYPEKLIPFFITRAIEGKNLPIYGDGQNTRDWTYVGDCVKGIWKILEVEGIEGEVINLGSGEEVSVLEVSKIILERLKKSTKLIKFVKDRPAHVKRLIADTQKAKKIINWENEVKFEEGIKKTIKWYKENRWWWEKRKKGKEFKEFEKRWYKDE